MAEGACTIVHHYFPIHPPNGPHGGFEMPYVAPPAAGIYEWMVHDGAE